MRHFFIVLAAAFVLVGIRSDARADPGEFYPSTITATVDWSVVDLSAYPGVLPSDLPVSLSFILQGTGQVNDDPFYYHSNIDPFPAVSGVFLSIDSYIYRANVDGSFVDALHSGSLFDFSLSVNFSPGVQLYGFAVYDDAGRVAISGGDVPSGFTAALPDPSGGGVAASVAIGIASCCRKKRS